VVRTWRFWALAVWFFCINGFNFAFLGLWAGPYLMDAYGFSPTATGTVLSLAAFSVIFGAPCLGYLSDRVLRSRKKVLVGAAACLLLVWSALLLFHGRLSYPALCVVSSSWGSRPARSERSGSQRSRSCFQRHRRNSHRHAECLSVYRGIVFQLSLGMILDRSGSAPYAPEAYVPVIRFLWSAVAAGLLCTLFVKETFKR
jgi:MFS family permease